MSDSEPRQKTILIIVENLPVPHDKRVWQESKSLTRAGYKVVIISPKGKSGTAKYEELEGVHIYRHPMPFEARSGLGFLIEYPWAFAWEFLLSIKVRFRHKFDVIHACNPPDNICVIAWFYKVFCKCRFLFDHHDGNLELWLAKGGSKGLVYKALRFFQNLTFKLADVSLVVNQHYIGIATDGGMAPEDVFEVRNAPARELLENVLRASRLVDVRKSEKCVVGYLGVMGKQDGVDNLMRIIKVIVHDRQRTDVAFRIMGDGPELKPVQKLARELGIVDHVEFTGWISGDDYIANLAGCDIGVNGDVVNEYNKTCSPNKIYEYMLFGLPMVQFDMPESKFISEEASLYARADDNEGFAAMILELVDDRTRREEMGRLGHERFLLQFTWESSEVQLLAAYERLFSKDRGTR